MITNQITTANTFNDWVVSTQAIITYLNDNEMLPTEAMAKADMANNTANYANSQVDLAFIKSQEAYDAANNSVINTGFAYNTANVANTTALYAYNQANTGTSIANFANDVAIFANTRIETIYNGSEILVPTGNTTQRPVTPSTGMFRYNTDTNQFEGYATAWMPVGGVPVGAVIPFIGGYFTNGSNAGYTNVLGNTVTNVNSLLNSTGWYVCNGATINLANSPIFNGSNRYLPNITDSRFIMGSTSSGTIGGSNTSDHNHSLNNHTHTINNHTHTLSAHEHTVPAHTHVIPAHGHQNDFYIVGSSLSQAQLASHQHYTNFYSGSTNVLAAGSSYKLVEFLLNGVASGATGSGGTHTHSLNGNVTAQAEFNTTYNAASTLRTTGGPISGQGTALDITGGSSLTTNGNVESTGLASSIENRPSFISCIYIMRVF